jgi:hypothetical protein
LIPASVISGPMMEPVLPVWLGDALRFEQRVLPTTSSRFHFNWTSVWLIGILFFSLRLLSSYAAVSRLRKYARSCSYVPSQFQKRFQFLISKSVSSPVATGLFKPVVLLPKSCSHWTFLEWQIVSEHESEHILRRHALQKLLSGICCVLYWFHPLVWFAARRHSQESERVCDERVLSTGIDKVVYAESLVRFAQYRQKRITCGADWLAHRSALECRLSALLGEPPTKLSLPQGIALAFFFFLTVFSTTFIKFDWDKGSRFSNAGLFFLLPQPNSKEDPYRLPESELVLPETDASVSEPRLTDDRDRSLFEFLRFLSNRVPRSSEDYVAKRARWAMAQAMDGELVRPLLKRMEDTDWRIRAYAAYVLGIARIPEAVPPLLRNMEDPIWRMRAMATFALAEIGSPDARDALKKSLGDPAWQVRVAAIPYFASRPEERSTIETLQTDPNPLVRKSAIEILRSMKN